MNMKKRFNLNKCCIMHEVEKCAFLISKIEFLLININENRFIFLKYMYLKKDKITYLI